MKSIGLAFCLAVFSSASMASVGVSVSVGEPGFYGQINIGNYPSPQVIYQQPVIVDRGPDYDDAPIYLRVPPGYERHWSRHCAAYHACGRRVYFVTDDWYTHDYAPRYREEHGHGRARGDNHRFHGHGDDHGGHGHGGEGHGHGHGRGDDD